MKTESPLLPFEGKLFKIYELSVPLRTQHHTLVDLVIEALKKPYLRQFGPFFDAESLFQTLEFEVLAVFNFSEMLFWVPQSQHLRHLVYLLRCEVSVEEILDDVCVLAGIRVQALLQTAVTVPFKRTISLVKVTVPYHL